MLKNRAQCICVVVTLMSRLVDTKCKDLMGDRDRLVAGAPGFLSPKGRSRVQ